MKRLALLTLLVLLATALPTLAQIDLGATYTLDSGTSINYPAEWNAQLEDSLVVISGNDVTRVIILDYPLVAQLMVDTEPSLAAAVAVVAEQILGDNYDVTHITAFSIAGREAARYDIAGGLNNAPGTIVAVRFSNERIGMLIAIDIQESTLTPMLESFDNSAPAQNVTARPQRGRETPLTEPDVFIFAGQGRVLVPIGWTYRAQMLNDSIEYLTLNPADNRMTVLMFDLSLALPGSTALADVVTQVGVNWGDEFGLTYTTGEATLVGNRAALRYNVVVNGRAGMMIVLHFDEGGTGLVIAYGAADSYAGDVDRLVSSFTSLNALLPYLQ